MQDLKSFAFQVESMRNAQKLYFQQAGKARKTRHPEDRAAAKETLDIAKQLEQVVDDSIAEIRTAIEVRPDFIPE